MPSVPVNLAILCLTNFLLSMIYPSHIALIAIFSFSSHEVLNLDPPIHSSLCPSPFDSYHWDSYSSSIHIYAYFWGNFFLVNQKSHLLPNRTVFTLLSHHLLHFDKIVLLRTKNRARSDDSDPSYESCSRKIVMLHRIAGNKSTSSSKSSFAVNSNGTFFSFSNIQKFMHNIHWRDRTISEIEFLMLDSILDKIIAVISLIVEPNNSRDS